MHFSVGGCQNPFYKTKMSRINYVWSVRAASALCGLTYDLYFRDSSGSQLQSETAKGLDQTDRVTRQNCTG